MIFLSSTILILLLMANSNFVLGSTQSAAVKGTLMCFNSPSIGTKVKLYDEDTLDIDDLLDEGVTDGEGRFELKGSTSEMTNIDPKLNIYHECNCNDCSGGGIFTCLKKVTIRFKTGYINEGTVPKKTFDIGVLNLGNLPAHINETRDCFNRR